MDKFVWVVAMFMQSSFLSIRIPQQISTWANTVVHLLIPKSSMADLNMVQGGWRPVANLKKFWLTPAKFLLFSILCPILQSNDKNIIENCI